MQQALFGVTALDIESTVGRAAMLALHDSSVDRATRRARALALIKLGKLFQGIHEAGDPVAPSSLAGKDVDIHGLASRPELNGQRARCVSFDAGADRYFCQLPDGSTLSLKAANLEPVA